MILYALIVRTQDGLALSASTDVNDEGLRDVKKSKRYLKLLAKKAHQTPDRCILNVGTHTIYLLTALGVSYLALCESVYPTVLSFSFLNELMKEFLNKYEGSAVNKVRRPYTYIDFNNFIHYTKHRYNKPQSLSTRMNLWELSEEIKLRPPHVLSISDIQPVSVNGSHPVTIPFTSITSSLPLERLIWSDLCTVLVSVLISCIDILRSLATMPDFGFDDLDGPEAASNAFVYIAEAIARSFQVTVLMLWGRKQLMLSWIAVALLALFSFHVWNLRDGWQNGLRICVTGFTQWCIFRRKILMRLPDYNV